MGLRTPLSACLVLALALAPLGARAQTAGNITVTETSIASQGGLSDGTINIAECQGPSVSTLAMTWTVSPTTPTPVAGNAFRVVAATTGGCDATTPFPIEADIPANGSISGSTTSAFNVRDMMIGLGLDTCAVATTTTQITLCATLVQSVGGGLVSPTQRAQTTITLDTRVPGKPTDVSAASGDSALDVSWATPSGVSPTNHRVTARACPARFDPATGDPATCTGAATTKNTNSASTSYRFTGLTNGVYYAITVQAVSAVGNGSTPSDPSVGLPQVVDDFWRRYQPGQETGGCGSGGAGLLALLGLLPLALRRRSP